MERYRVINSESLKYLKTLPDNCIDAIVTDPPYGLSNFTAEDTKNIFKAWLNDDEYKHNKKGFMSKDWDGFVPSIMLWKECFRVLKPGGHILAFAGTRTYHLMAMSIELSGFEIRDMISWVYGSGFPKSHNIDKSLNKKIEHELKKQYDGEIEWKQMQILKKLDYY